MDKINHFVVNIILLHNCLIMVYAPILKQVSQIRTVLYKTVPNVFLLYSDRKSVKCVTKENIQ